MSKRLTKNDKREAHRLRSYGLDESEVLFWVRETRAFNRALAKGDPLALQIHAEHCAEKYNP